MKHPDEGGMARREFVKGAVALSALGTVAPAAVFAQGTTQKAGTAARIFMTSDTKKHETLPDVALKRAGELGGGAPDVVSVDAAQRFQPILGFGCAYTDASCFLLNSMQADSRQKFLTETFSPAAMNLNAGRTTIGASDYSRDVYNYDDVKDDVTMQHFSIAHDEAYILPMLREMRGINPDLFLLSTPWSPPGWMKTYGSMLGGWMTFKYLAPYALYFSRFLEAYRAAGVPINAVTSQNELETDQGGSMPASYWTPEIETDFIKDHLGPLLKQEKQPTEIWLLDHNYDLWKRVRWQMQDAELRKYVSGVAWHGYVGTADMMSRLHDVEPQLPFYWTEGGPDIVDPKYSYDWTRWGGIFTDAMANWCRCIITWNLMLDPQGKPNIGPFQCGGLVTLKDGNSLIYSGQYWTLRHFSQHVKRGALRVASHSDATELRQIAFLNPDGTRVVVLTNTGTDRDVRIVFGETEVTVRLDRMSVATVIV